MAAADALALSGYGTNWFVMPYSVHFTAWKYGQISVLFPYFMMPFLTCGGTITYACDW